MNTVLEVHVHNIVMSFALFVVMKQEIVKPVLMDIMLDLILNVTNVQSNIVFDVLNIIYSI